MGRSAGEADFCSESIDLINFYIEIIFPHKKKEFKLLKLFVCSCTEPKQLHIQTAYTEINTVYTYNMTTESAKISTTREPHSFSDHTTMNEVINLFGAL
jgi:hypothetical protein